jgi:hypothetical protein
MNFCLKKAERFKEHPTADVATAAPKGDIEAVAASLLPTPPPQMHRRQSSLFVIDELKGQRVPSAVVAADERISGNQTAGLEECRQVTVLFT